MTSLEHRKLARAGNYEEGTGGRVKCREKTERINLGLALLSRRAAGVPLVFDDIAAWCGCSEQAIVAIFQKAMRKVRRAFGAEGRGQGAEVSQALREGLEFFNERGREVARARFRKEAA